MGAQTTPSTWAQIATIPRNKVTDASAKASSATVRTMVFFPSSRTKREHSSLIVLRQAAGSGSSAALQMRCLAHYQAALSVSLRVLIAISAVALAEK